MNLNLITQTSEEFMKCKNAKEVSYLRNSIISYIDAIADDIISENVPEEAEKFE